MTHEEAFALLEAYVDEQLALSDVLQVEAHLPECERCRSWLQERRALRARIHSAPLRYALPPEVEQAIRRPLTKERLGTSRPWWAQALAAGLVMGFIGLWVGHSLPQRQDEGEAWVSAHVRSTLSAHSVDVLSSSHHTVKPWLSSKLPFSPPVPELEAQGDALLGARTDYINRMAVAALRYQHGNHQIDVFVWPSSQGPAPRASDTPIAGFRLATAQVAGFTAVMVSDMSARELDAFRERWRAQAALQ